MALNLKSTLNSLTTTKIEENSVKNVSLKLNSKFFSRRRRRNFLRCMHFHVAFFFTTYMSYAEKNAATPYIIERVLRWE